jgi:Zinc knuckle
MGAILNRPTWPTTLDEWQDVARDETNRHKARKAILGGRQPLHHVKPQQQYQPQHDPDAMEVNIIETRHAYQPTLQETTTRAPKTRRHGQTCYVCRKKGHYAKDCPNRGAITTAPWSRPGDQSISYAQLRRWTNSRLRTTPQVAEVSRSTPNHQTIGNTMTRQYTHGPLPQTMTTLPWSGPGYQSNRTCYSTRQSNNGTPQNNVPRSRLGYQSNRNHYGTQQSVNGTTQNNVPMAPPSYRTNSWTPSLTLPQSALGNQSNTMGQIRNTDTYTQNMNNPTSFVAKAPTERTRIMQTNIRNSQVDTQNSVNGPQKPTTAAQLTKFIIINFVAKEIWLPFDFVTHRGMVEEKALIDSGANKNCINIKTAEKLGIKPRLLPEPMGLQNVDGTDNRGGWIKYWLPIAMFQGGRARMLKFLIVDLGQDRIILRYPWFREFNPDINWPTKFIKGPPFLTADTTIEPNHLITHAKAFTQRRYLNPNGQALIRHIAEEYEEDDSLP